ncbi:MAG: sulfatase-like hydrolase/transferase [Phycisphaeraceae bacterium]
MTRALVSVCFVLAPLTAAQAEDNPVRPNIVFILADDLGKEWVSAYGAEDIETPQIDRMAEEGMMLHSAYAMPQCTPTRVSFLTGQLPHNHGWVNHWDVPRWGSGAHFDPEMNNSLAKILRDAGYATAASGKWQVDDFRANPDAMDDAGFDDWAMWTGFESGNSASSRRYWDPYIHTREGSKTYEGEFGPDIYANFLLDFMEEHKGAGEPFFVYYAMALPHTPFVTTPDEPDAEGRRAKHKAMTRYIDKLTGNFVDKVREGDFDRPTLVIFTTDNGTVGSIRATINGRQVRGGKTALDEMTGTAMPYIAWGPGLVPEGVESHQITDEADVLPTLAELAGATVQHTQLLGGLLNHYERNAA